MTEDLTKISQFHPPREDKYDEKGLSRTTIEDMKNEGIIMAILIEVYIPSTVSNPGLEFGLYKRELLKSSGKNMPNKTSQSIDNIK
jgi:hypothetical protein